MLAYGEVTIKSNLATFHLCFQKYQYYLDKLTPLVAIRWVLAVSLICLFLFRIVFLQVIYRVF